jgi:D-threo-aldose 1-dehydrogenase
MTKRYALALDLVDNDDLIAEYEKWHRKENQWPEIQKSILDAGILDMQIYRTGNRLFMIIETDESFSFDRKSIMDKLNVKVQEWEKLMWKYQKQLPWAKGDEKWILMNLVYQLESKINDEIDKSGTGSDYTLKLPPVVFGTSGLGNLYVASDDNTKLAVVATCVSNSPEPVVFDSAGKYGAGLALESLGKTLAALKVDPARVMISNKLGWYRIPLTTQEPTFEPGVWKNIKFDAEQRISYQGILQCFEQGNALLNGYHATLVSVHDPDEYLDAAKDKDDRAKRMEDIMDAYKALFELKAAGKVKAVGIGAKNWKVIREVTDKIRLDWVMIANSMTLHSHPDALLAYMKQLEVAGIPIINSAVFNGGFLTGGDYYNYKLVTPGNAQHDELNEWRNRFNSICEKYKVNPAHACVQFGLNGPGVKSIAMSTTKPENVLDNLEMAKRPLEPGFWKELESIGLIHYQPKTN